MFFFVYKGSDDDGLIVTGFCCINIFSLALRGRQHVGKTNRFLLTLSARYRNSLFGWTITICKRKHIIFHGGFSKKGVISLYANVYGYRLVWCSTIVDFSKIIQCPVDGVGGPLLWKMFFSDPFFQEELYPPLYTFLWVELVPLV